MVEIQLGKVGQAAELAAQGKKTIHSVLHRLALGLAEEPGRSPGLARAVMSSFLASESVRAIIERNMREGRQVIAAVVAAGQERGEIDSHLDSERVALQLQQTMMGTVLLWSLQGEPALKKLIEDSFQYFWRSIALSGKK
jgi:AcrR family transcriptional regulator